MIEVALGVPLERAEVPGWCDFFTGPCDLPSTLGGAHGPDHPGVDLALLHT